MLDLRYQLDTISNLTAHRDALYKLVNSSGNLFFGNTDITDSFRQRNFADLKRVEADLANRQGKLSPQLENLGFPANFLDELPSRFRDYTNL